MAPHALLLLLSLSVVLRSLNVHAADSQCRNWQVINKPQPGDYAILLSSLYITRLDETDPGKDYEMWGYFEARHGDWIMGKTYFGTPDSHKICKISDLGGPKNYATTIAALAVTAGVAIATGGTSVVAQGVAGAVGGFSVIFAEDQITGTDACPDGLLGSVTYPVSYKTNTLPYNFRAEIIEDDSWPSSDEHYYINTKVGDWSTLDQCWGVHFQDRLIPRKNCEQEVSICTTWSCKKRSCFRGNRGCRDVSSEVGKAVIQSVVVAWIRGPLQDGEVQALKNDNIVVERPSWYGPKSGLNCPRQ